MDIHNSYLAFEELSLKNRFFKHHELVILLNKLPETFKVQKLGNSFNGKSINLVVWGNGDQKVMLWSQMHGDEATGTMALFDLMNYLQTANDTVKSIAEKCTLYIIPMVNPDGAEIFTRRNAQQIDINRDFLARVSPEAQLLINCRDSINPQFGFNLHDQNTLWSVSDTLKPATLSFLAPATDKENSISEARKNAMLVIADIYNDLSQELPQQIGLFDDEYEPRAFGDNFQRLGTSTILIEAGGFKLDFEKQEIRKFYFSAILSGLQRIAKKSYLKQELSNYLNIPENSKKIFHILIKNVKIDEKQISIGINYEENIVADDFTKTVKNFNIEDIGDLSSYGAYQVFEGQNLRIEGEIIFNKPANFSLVQNSKVILSFQNGIPVSNTLNSVTN
jgi:hypothetical protein